jgi:hypothetical protein
MFVGTLSKSVENSLKAHAQGNRRLQFVYPLRNFNLLFVGRY